MTGTPPSPKPLRVSRTRRALIEAGKRLMSEGRMRTASIDDLVREADVAKGSFFNHFATREALMDEVLATVRTDLESQIEDAQRGATDPASRLTRGLLASYRYGMRNQVGARVLMLVTPERVDRASQPYSLLARDLAAGSEQGVFELPSLDAGVVLLLGLSDLGLARLLDVRDEFAQAREIMRGVCLTMLRALGVDSQRRAVLVDEALRVVVDEPRRGRGGP